MIRFIYELSLHKNMVSRKTISMPGWVANKIDELKPKTLKNTSEFYTELLIRGMLEKEKEKNKKGVEQSPLDNGPVVLDNFLTSSLSA